MIEPVNQEVRRRHTSSNVTQRDAPSEGRGQRTCSNCGRPVKYRVLKLLLCRDCGEAWTDQVIAAMREGG